MQTVTMESLNPASQRYARCIAASRRVRWDIDHDVLRGRQLDFSRKFLPDGLTRVRELDFLRPNEVRFLSQVQGRTYANMFALVERYIGAKTLELSRDHWLGDQTALEALVRLADEEIKHQELFRRIEQMTAQGMPAGYRFMPDANAVAQVVLSKGSWAVMALTLDIEIFTQVHYRASIEPDESLSDLWKDVFLYHWKEEAQHAILDELEWKREDAKVSAAQRDTGVDELIQLVGAVDGICQLQAKSDSDYFVNAVGRKFSAGEDAAIRDAMLKAYRYQYIVSGATEPRYVEVLKSLTTARQLDRVVKALGPIAAHVAG